MYSTYVQYMEISFSPASHHVIWGQTFLEDSIDENIFLLLSELAVFWGLSAPTGAKPSDLTPFGRSSRPSVPRLD
jgi:hypothetical protein